MRAGLAEQRMGTCLVSAMLHFFSLEVNMSRKLVIILGALGVSAATLSGCVDESGYRYYESRAPIIYREQVVIERVDYYVRPGAGYHHGKTPRHIYYPVGERRSPRCFGTNCYVGATYREDPYYRLAD
jgi:hypothetical protein